jgi:hypothetical protein
VDVGLAAAGAPQRAVAVGADVQVPGVVLAGDRPADGASPAAALIPLFTPELIQVMRRTIPADHQDHVATGVIVKARKPG